MTRKKNKGGGAIHSLMQDLMTLQGRQAEVENSPGQEDRSKKSGGRRYQDKLSFPEKIEYHQQKLHGLKRAEKLDALLSHPNMLLDFDPKELRTLTETLKSTLGEFKQKIHHTPPQAESDRGELRQELDRIHGTLGALSQDIGRVMELINSGKEQVVRPEVPVEKKADAAAVITGPGAPTEVPEMKEEKPGLGGPSAEHEERVEDEGKDKMEKVQELRQRLDHVYKMIEMRSAKEKDRVESLSPPANDVIELPPPSPPPEPEVAETVAVDLEGEKKGFAEDFAALKSDLEPLENLAFEQYLHDLQAYDPQNRKFAIQKLGEMRRKELAGILLDSWEKETDNSVRVEILNALADMDYENILDFLQNALNRPDPKIVVAALEGLYRFGGKEAAEEFVKALDHPHYSIRRRAGTYLGWMEAEWAIPDLVKLLRDPDVYNRKVGVSILSKFQAKQLIFFFIETLNDPDQGVREAVIKSLSSWTGQDMEYDPAADDTERSLAINVWKQWWEQSEAKGFEFKPKAKSVKISKDMKNDGAREKILTALEKQKNGLTLKKIAENIGTPWRGLTGVISQLCQEDLLVKKGNNYSLKE